MFTTFVGAPPRSLKNDHSSTGATPSIPARPKRSQVARACDWCRVHRIKCDSNYPCHNCQNRGGQCSNKGTSDVRTLPHAVRSLKNGSASLPTPPASSAASPPPALDPFKELEGKRKYWEGIHTSTAQSHQTQCYGPSSLFYFIGRMGSYLEKALQQPHSDHHMQPNSASRVFASPTSPWNGSVEQNMMETDSPITEEYLTSTQEEYFLGLYWQSYHCTLQVIDESEFREHYKSLWTTPGAPRKPSALVDIVLALCMQYGTAFLPRNDAEPRADVNINDATVAGRWFYRRCQSLLTCDMESPSITTLQCHFLSVIYLCNASFTNMAHFSLALSMRTAHILGLHLEPPEDMPRKQKELRRRLWWTLFAIESKTSMKLGRPFAAQFSQVTCKFPADDHELALVSGSNFSPFDESITWLTYTLQNANLILAARAIYTAFYDKCADVLGSNGGKNLYNDPQSLETCADFLNSSMKCLHNWLQSVPKQLKTKRKGAGEAFSTDRSALEIELFAPLWLQRQRLLLELLYHNLSMNLYRPFISFSPASSATPIAEGHAISCVNHAIAITHIMHQVLTETDILSGWHEPFQWQWNATLSMIGFVLAYPIAPSTPSARKAINNAIAVFENFGNNFAIAASAANVTRDLAAKADYLISRIRTGLTGSVSPSGPSSQQPSQCSYPNTVETLQSFDSPDVDQHVNNNQAVVPLLGDSSVFDQNAFGGSMGLAFTVDSFNSFEPLSDSSNMFDTWSFTQD
ncbi:fungal-specific transcription factor domain-containing protein [Patellaria atrata CBS 101060]|uniref:Fungal-specific transcription factor domain-containing protein n=1 Tax=Patellaria atrata CBS 101060 TaxID=1346257 RepID=A0A9P4S6J7_9PEZI|nr:fungal-specific transcription factor domain-containing protein [Patellaria atrata CBS 101060]